MSALELCFLSEPPVEPTSPSTVLCNLTPLMPSCPGRHEPREPATRYGYRLRAQLLPAVLMAGWPNGKLAGAPHGCSPHLSLPPPAPRRARACAVRRATGGREADAGPGA